MTHVSLDFALALFDVCLYSISTQDEAVPLAQASRPNLVTKAALVDQAFALSVHDVDTLAKYDLHLREDGFTTTTTSGIVVGHETQDAAAATKKIDALTKERIFHYQAKIAAAKQQLVTKNNKPRSNSTEEPSAAPPPALATSTFSAASSLTAAAAAAGTSVSPPANLVAALRRVYEPEPNTTEPSLPVTKLKVETTTNASSSSSSSSSSNSLFELRQLLQSVSSHVVFQGSGGAAVDESGTAAGGIVAGCLLNSSPKQAQANLEMLIMNVAKQVTDQKEDSEASLQGLLMAILSVLTISCSSQPSMSLSQLSPAGLGSDQDDPKRAKMAEAKRTQPKELIEQDDLPFQSVLQVGALLSLLPLGSGSANASAAVSSSLSAGSTTADDAHVAAAVVESSPSSSDYASVGRLDPALLEYFAAAAAVFEERWEIRKARLLARTQTPPPTSTERSHTPPPGLIFSSSSQKDDEEEEEDGDDEEQHQDNDDGAADNTDHTNNAETPTAGDRRGPTMDDSETESPSFPDAIAAAVVEVDAEPQVAVNDQIAVVDHDEEGEEAGTGNIDDEDEESSGSESEQGGISDHEEEEDDEEEDEPYESNSDGMMEDAASGNEDGEHPDQDDHDEAGDESSSSSSSESSDEEGIGDSDGDALETDEDDDDAAMRQALAMSMTAHEVAEASAEEAALVEPRAIESSTDGVVVPSASDEIQSDEENSVPASEDATPAMPSDATPASRSTDELQTDTSGHEEEIDESNLPPFPEPPEMHQFSVWGGTNRLTVTDDPDARTSSKASMPTFDPSELGDFGSIPTSHVLFHLLRFTASLVEQRLSIDVKSSMIPSVFAGGMGCSLFAMDRQSNEETSAEAPGDTKHDVTLQLMVASFLLMVEHRNDAIENLRKAIAREQQVAQDGDFDSDDDDDEAAEDDSSRAPLSSSGEEDDPALTLAMNYVEDDVPLSSDSLENKGMMRKAAAAAHDAAAMLKSLRKRTDAWKNEVRLFSTFVSYSMKMLRQFLQYVVRQSFVEDLWACRNGRSLSVLDFNAYLPSFVVAKLSETLGSLTVVSTQSVYLAMLGGEELETEKLFLSLSHYREALSLWGECIPLFYSSDIDRSNLLKSSLEGCSNFSFPSQHLPNLDKLAAFPASDIEPQVHKLRIVCRRLRIRDLLEGFVSRPIPYLPDDANDGHSMTLDSQKLSQDPRMSSWLVSLLGDSISHLAGDRSEAQRLYLALCHRCHARILLLDGFYAATETESDDRPASSSTAKALSTGDTVRVAAGPSNVLQFDATKCSDSIALLSGASDDSSGATSGTGSVHQRASKLWGTVLSTHLYSPKTGVHRWAVRLDKCERGHVFIGVATAQASTRTYVGGDKYGWGMIGTQALWHDRRKVCAGSTATSAFRGSRNLTLCLRVYTRYEAITVLPLGQGPPL